MAKPLVTDMLQGNQTSRAELSKAFFGNVKSAARRFNALAPKAELTISTGKIKVVKAFKLGPLEVKLGEFDLRKWAVTAGGAYAVCTGNRPTSQVSERTFERCMTNAIDAAAAAFGWKGFRPQF